MTNNTQQTEQLISKKVENLVRSKALQGLIGPTAIYMSPSELNQRLSYLRFSTDEIVKIVNQSDSDLEIRRPACHRVKIRLNGGDE